MRHFRLGERDAQRDKLVAHVDTREGGQKLMAAARDRKRALGMDSHSRARS